MNYLDVILVVFFIVVVIGIGLYFLNKWAYKRMDEQQSVIERTKQQATIYIIDKKKMKAQDSNLPKAVLAQLPRMYKFMKVYLVKAKIGPQIMTLMCEKKVFNTLPVKKNVKVELAGIYIVSVKAGRTEHSSKGEAKKPEKQSVLDTAKDKVKGIFSKKK